MFATPLRNLLLATAVIAGSLIALGNGRIDSVVTSALSDPVMSAKLDAVVPNREHRRSGLRQHDGLRALAHRSGLSAAPSRKRRGYCRPHRIASASAATRKACAGLESKKMTAFRGNRRRRVHPVALTTERRAVSVSPSAAVSRQVTVGFVDLQAVEAAASQGSRCGSTRTPRSPSPAVTGLAAGPGSGFRSLVGYCRRLMVLGGSAVSAENAARFALAGLLGLAADLLLFEVLFLAGVRLVWAHAASFAVAAAASTTP